MNEDKLIKYVAVITLCASLLALGITYYSISNLAAKITGYATGTANLTVETQAAINFTTATIDWGSGKVNNGQTFASLNTFETNNVTNGNWTLQQSGGLRLENIGNVNVSVYFTVGKNASNFIGGTNPGYQLNITSAEPGSCINASFALGVFYTVNTSMGTFLNCSTFGFESTKDLIRIDINLTVPENSLQGALSDTITATAYV